MFLTLPLHFSHLFVFHICCIYVVFAMPCPFNLLLYSVPLTGTVCVRPPSHSGSSYLRQHRNLGAGSAYCHQQTVHSWWLRPGVPGICCPPIYIHRSSFVNPLARPFVRLSFVHSFVRSSCVRLFVCSPFIRSFFRLPVSESIGRFLPLCNWFSLIMTL